MNIYAFIGSDSLTFPAGFLTRRSSRQPRLLMRFAQWHFCS